MFRHPSRNSSLRKSLAISLAILICFALLFSTLVIPRRAAASGGQGQARQGRPEAGPPAANLPNLDEVRRKRQPEPQAPPQVPSTMRARRKALVPRNGLKVGDPGTTLGAFTGSAGVPPAGTESLPLRSSAKTFAASALKSPPSSSLSHRSKLNHPRTSTKTRSLPLAVPPPIGDDQYVQTFFSYALARQPYSNEQAYFDDMLRACSRSRADFDGDGGARDGQDFV
jgi:hypothetical protein